MTAKSHSLLFSSVVLPQTGYYTGYEAYYDPNAYQAYAQPAASVPPPQPPSGPPPTATPLTPGTTDAVPGDETDAKEEKKDNEETVQVASQPSIAHPSCDRPSQLKECFVTALLFADFDLTWQAGTSQMVKLLSAPGILAL